LLVVEMLEMLPVVDLKHGGCAHLHFFSSRCIPLLLASLSVYTSGSQSFSLSLSLSPRFISLGCRWTIASSAGAWVSGRASGLHARARQSVERVWSVVVAGSR
jgi:hypothetical protein